MTARHLRTLSAVYISSGALFGLWSYVMYRIERRTK